MNKKISFILVICILFMELTFPMGTVHAEAYGIYTYTINNGEVTITDCDSSASGSIEIPDCIGEYPVTSIGNYAFSDCSSLTNITIPESVTSIGRYAFQNCSSLKSIIIPDGVTSIGSRAFGGCSSLTSVAIPSSITSICNYVFSGCCSLKIVVIPNSITSIGDYAFSGCSGITNIIMSDSVTSIGESAFGGCRSLTSITIPDSVIYVGSNAFYNCSSLEGVYISNMAAWCSIYFKDICSNPLYYAKKLYLNNNLITDLVIPEGVASVEGTFVGIDSLKSITIPTSLQSIGREDFASCEQINAIYISDIAAWCGIKFINSNLFKCAKSLYLNNELVTDLVIPESVSNINNNAFYGCESITSVVISNSVTSIGSGAFQNCINLKNIKLGYSVEDINANAFLGCSSIEKITLDKNNTNCVLQDDVLYNSSKTQLILYPRGSERTSFDIPDTVTKINNGVFKSCKNLKSLTIPGSITSIDNSTFSGCSGLTSVTILPGVRSIGDYAFQSCSRLTSITIPDSVTSIGKYAFQYCRSLTNISIPDGVTSIGNYAFSYCSNLTSITIPNSVTSIGDYAFSYCGSLASITIPDSVTSIGYHAFQNCSGLTSIIIPGSIENIDNEMFLDCSNLTSVTILPGVRSIGYSAFSGCSGLTSITIPDSVTSIGEDAFFNCRSLTSITIPDSVMSIGKWAFSNCSGLTSITIPGSVTSIGEWAFSGCRNLAEILVDENNENYCSQDGILFSKQKNALIRYPEGGLEATYSIPDSVTSIGEDAFSGCSGLTSITIPGSVTSIGDSAFSYCGSLTEILVDENNENYCSQDGILFNKQKTALIKYPGGGLEATYSIPDSVTSIGKNAFKGCRSLTDIIIPESVTSIGDSAFYICRSLTGIAIPDSVTSIGRSAFWGSSLSDVYYSGSEFDREKINISTGNDLLLNATWHYKSNGPTDTVVIKTEDISAMPGTSVKVDIMLENNPGTAIIGFNIGYDGNAMTLASVTNGKIFDDADILNGNIQKNPYMFTCMNSTENKNGDGVLVSLTFNISENCPAGDYVINISGCEAYSIDESAINCKTVDSKVTVSNGTGAGIDISVSIPNYEKGGTVTAALYDKSGKLLSVKSYTPAESINVSFERSGAYIKVMHWNMDKMIPLSPMQLIIPTNVPN